MAVGVIMPRQGQSVESCIIELRVKEGDKVNAGDILFGYETDKASFEEESPAGGTVLKVLVSDGDDVPCLDTVLVIGEPGENISEFAGSSETAAEVKEEVKSEAAPVAMAVAPVSTATADSEMKISPRAKSEAERQNLDLSKAVPTGPNGRIIERDVMVLAEKGYKVTAAAATDYAGGKEGTGLGGAVSVADLAAAPAAQAAAPIVAAPTVPEAEYTDTKLPNIRKVIAKSMHASLAELAQLTNSTSFDATAILNFRERLKANAEKLGLPNITLNDIILYAVSRTLKKHPDMNAHFLNGDTMRHFSHVNLGMAVDTERGLLVPTLFGADTLSLADISRKAKELAASAQSGRISPDLLTGGTFTISNLGAMGIESFTPIINPPQTGILGVCSVVYRQKKVGDSFVTYPAMGLSLTYDHRVVDGAPASRFLKDLCTALESFDILLAL
jgi:pyruvate dehydrogenase E2 component (dihydrolipoamide acetyltransferase)